MRNQDSSVKKRKYNAGHEAIGELAPTDRYSSIAALTVNINCNQRAYNSFHSLHLIAVVF